MKGREIFSRIVSLSLCVILLLSLAEFPEQEPFGLHHDSDGKRILLGDSDVDPGQVQLSESDPELISNPFDGGPCIATVAMLPGLSPRRFELADAGFRPPGKAGPGSPTVLRI